MIYAEPLLTAEDERVLMLIEQQQKRLSILSESHPRRWHGTLRRNMFARAIQGSNTIEGYNATLDEAVAIVEREPPLDERTEAWLALSGYRDAMTYILQASGDPTFEFSGQLLKSLHYIMTSFDLNTFPGRWRPGAVFVVNQSSRETVYDPPDAGQLEGLILELVTYLGAKPRRSAYVSAAMAHLNLTLIHPFKDGNGRMARALQTLILAREGLVNPVFSSIEEWLGQNTEAYYSVLTAVAQGAWSPGNSALPWVRFCLRAHYQQADRMIRRFDEYDALYAEVATIVARLRLNDRVSMPLFDCALGQHMTNTRYQKETGVSQFVSGRDLKDLADLGLLQPFGEKRGRFYRAGSDLKAAYARVRIRVASIDPYLSASDSPNQEPRLPGL